MTTNKLETTLEAIFVKSAPKLPEASKQWLVTWLPWINLILGIFTLWSVYWLWHWAHLAKGLATYANQLSQAFGGGNVLNNRMTTGLWLGVIVLAIEAFLYIVAFPATKDRRRRGWYLLFYALLVNLVYGVIILFTDYGGFGSFLASLVGSVIGLWLLFQIREKYHA